MYCNCNEAVTLNYLITMNKVILNIGLNVGNEEPTKQLNKTLQLISAPLFKVVSVKVHENSEYNENGERCLVVYMNHSLPIEYLKAAIETVAELLQQQCIAVKFNGIGFLAYDENYKGERFDFVEKYFKY